MPAAGNGASGILLVGEAPGADEAAKGEPFVGMAGKELNALLRRASQDRDVLRVHNVLSCFPAQVTLAARDVNRFHRRYYQGRLVTVYARNGWLSGTPNHPVWTKRGWVPLGHLHEGDYLVRGGFRQRVSSSDPDVERIPTSFGEAFNSAANSGVRERVIGRRMDFHGDGRDGQVEVVRADGVLWNWAEPAQIQPPSESILQGYREAQCPCQRNGSGESPYSDLFWTHASPAKSLVGRRCEGLTSCWPGTQEPDVHGTRPCAKRDAESLQRSAGPAIAPSELLGKCLEALPIEVALDEVRKVASVDFEGWVYNVSCHAEQYTANGYIVHNCRPPGNVLVGASWEAGAIAHCTPNLDRTIREMQPKVIVALGNTPLARLCHVSGISRHRGYILQGGPLSSWVVPTYHPSYLLPRRGQTSSSKFTGAVVRDLKLAAQIARDGFTRPAVCYIEDPPPTRAEMFADEYDASDARYLAVDIETPYKQDLDEIELDDVRAYGRQTILRISFAFRPRYAISVPFTPPYHRFIRRMLEAPRPKVGWNSWAFDYPVLREAGYPVAGPLHDGMACWKVLQPSLPAGLESASSFFCDHLTPWKHLSDSRPAWYSCVDADATITDMLAMEQELRRGTERV